MDIHSMSGQPTQVWKLLRALGTNNREWLQQSYQKAPMTEPGGMTGAFLMPPGYTAEFYEGRAEMGFFRPRARKVPMTTSSMICPRPNFETVQASGTTPFFGGFVFSWQNMNAIATSSPDVAPDKPMQSMNLQVRDLVGLLTVSNQFMADIGDEGERMLVRLAGEASGWYEEYAFFNGDGTKSPLGILKSPARAVVARALNNNIAQSDVAKMAERMYPRGWRKSVWACSPKALGKVSVITGFIPNQNMGTLEEGCVGSLLARPLYVTEKLPTLGTEGDLVFFDPSAYVIGDRAETFVDVSIHPKFTTGQSVIRVWSRLDGLPLFDNIVTMADATQTVSAYVVLGGP